MEEEIDFCKNHLINGVVLEVLKKEGKIDLAVGLIPQLGAGFYQQRLFVQRYVCLMREDHPLATGDFSLDYFRTAHHAVVVAQGTGHGIIEEQLANAGVKRPVRLTLPHFATAGKPYAKNCCQLASIGGDVYPV